MAGAGFPDCVCGADGHGCGHQRTGYGDYGTVATGAGGVWHYQRPNRAGAAVWRRRSGMVPELGSVAFHGGADYVLCAAVFQAGCWPYGGWDDERTAAGADGAGDCE